MSLESYHATTSDWRLQLQRNERKTRWVIATFLLIYGVVGCLVDVVILKSSYPYLTLSQCLYVLASFQVVPYGIITMGAVAAISLWITFHWYDRLMLLGTDYREITLEARNLQERQLYHVVEEMKVAAGLQYMPKVFIIEAQYMNAFASGYSERSAMVAITRGLLEKLDRAELQAVMAHELSHIRHHDIKLTLTVAVLSNIFLIVVDFLFYTVMFRRDKERDNHFAFVIVVLRYVLPLITVLLALFLSRTREFMADAGSVELMRDNNPMARALLKISQDHEAHAREYEVAYGQTPHEEVRRAAYLYDPSGIDPVKSFSQLFATHPSVAERLKAIGFQKR